MVIKRIYDQIEKHLVPNKALIIYGPRRIGKTTLVKNYLEKTPFKYKLDFGDNIRTQNILSSQDFNKILPYAEGYELLVLDEAQYIPNIGMGLKIIVDQIPGIRVLVTGSSSFELAGQVGEPLTGRKNTLTLFPIAQKEMLGEVNKFELKERLEDFLIYGAYPEVVTATTRENKIKTVEEVVNSYLFKDILALEKIRSPQTLLDLLKLLSFQIGNLVSLNELANRLLVDVKTVARYLDILEKSFVIVSLSGLRRNLRREIGQKKKYYFLDNGIRNGVISQFNRFADRNDIGQLWENFIFSERLKKRSYDHLYANPYFWRTHDGAEIDLVEEGNGKYSGYEFGWQKEKFTPPSVFLDNYQNSSVKIINKENYLDFVI